MGRINVPADVEVRDVVLADGLVVHCLLSGDPSGPVLVLLHGLGEGSASWDEVAPAFAERYRVIALDLRGHGASSWPGTYSYELMRDDVVGVLDALGLDEVVLVGHSMGGAVAHVLTQTRPHRVAALVVEDAPPPFPRAPRPLPDRPAEPLPFLWAVLAAVRASRKSTSCLHRARFRSKEPCWLGAQQDSRTLVHEPGQRDAADRRQRMCHNRTCGRP